MICMSKDFFNELCIVGNFIQHKHPFAFTRFSDGELYVMQNKVVKIKDKRVIVGEDYNNPVSFEKEDEKEFLPEQHQNFRSKLIDAYKYTSHTYIKGIPCRCCVGEENHKWALDNTSPNSNLTWSNLFVNTNYPFFIEQIVPLFKEYEVVLVCNEKADITNLPFKVVKDYRVGANCMINNLDLIDTMVSNHKEDKGKLFLFSASSLSALLIHKLHESNTYNTYLNIGTTLNFFLKMSMERDYLKQYWLGDRNYFGSRKCIW